VVYFLTRRAAHSACLNRERATNTAHGTPRSGAQRPAGRCVCGCVTVEAIHSWFEKVLGVV